MTKNVLARFFLASVLGASALTPAYVGAEDNERYFYPKNKWIIEKVSADNGLPICSISNQLNNGYIVQFAGTKDGVSNLNIDFRQPAFSKGKKYEVQYIIPGQNAALVPTKAFKDSLLVSDLRNQQNLSQGLLDAAAFDIKIRDNEFRIYLTGLNASLKDYNDCTDPGGVLAAKDENNAQKERILAMEPEVHKNLAPLPPVRETQEDSAQISIAQDGESALKRPPSNPNKVRYSEKIAEQLKSQSDEYKPEGTENAADEVVDVALQKKLDNAKENDGVIYNITKPEKPIVADLTKLDDRQDQVAEEIVAKDTHSKKLIDPSSDIAPSGSSDMDADPIPADIDMISPATGVDNLHVSEMQNKISNLEAQLATLQNKNAMLDDELKSTLQDAKQEQMSVSSKNWNLEMATMKFNEAENQIMRLGRQLQSARAQCDQEKQKLETMLFDPTLTSQEQLARLSSLEAELEDAKSELYRQQRQYEERIRLLESQLNAL